MEMTMTIKSKYTFFDFSITKTCDINSEKFFKFTKILEEIGLSNN
jgi:hypothetical protein